MQNKINNSDLINTIDIINQYLLGNENLQSLQETISKLNNNLQTKQKYNWIIK